MCDNSNMKRENEDNYDDDQQLDEEQQQMLQGDENAPEQGTDNDDSQDPNNDTNNLNSQNNQNQDNGVGPNPPKRQRRNDDEEIRLLIPSKMAGAVIGKGGHNIQKLRTEYKAQVNVGDCQGPERVITIGADLETCCNVIKDIMKHLDKGNADECEVRMLLHQSLAGCVIGKGGSKIKELKDRIGCRLKIFSNIAPQSTDRIAQIIGKEEQCIECLTEIVDLLKMTPIKGPVHNYDPHNFDDAFADEYGGYGSGSLMNGGSFRNGAGGGGNGGGASRFGNERGTRFNDRGGNRGGGFGGNDRRGNGNGNGMERRAGGVDPWAHNGNNGGSPLMGSGGSLSTFGMGSNNSLTTMNLTNNGGPNSQDSGFGSTMDMNKQSTQVTIPKDLAGAIIGKGGSRIRRIRTESNAFIQIDEALPGSSDRIITITGSPKQIQAAQYMLQQSIRAGSK